MGYFAVPRECRRWLALSAAAAVMLGLGTSARGQESFRFRTGIDLVNVTATVTDSSGRVAPRLTKDDFVVYEDDQRVDVTHFSAERVPVSLGIVLDTSGSMAGEKLVAARAALDRFLFDLLGADDEFFLYRFDNRPHLVTGWTQDRQQVGREMNAIRADGATALYDAVAAALPLLESGRHRKKALLVISDGHDSSSRIDLARLEQLIRESDALVYAIGIDAQPPAPSAGRGAGGGDLREQRRRPSPFPMPRIGRPRNPPVPGTPGGVAPRAPKMPPASEPSRRGINVERERVDAAALHEITDDSGGRTEIVRDAADLGPTATRIADELSTQYYLGYQGRGHNDGLWHTIKVEVRDPALRVRARRGYVAVREGALPAPRSPLPAASFQLTAPPQLQRLR